MSGDQRPARRRMAGMDAADYHRLADQYGAPDEERDHELANARWDLEHRPERIPGGDPYVAAAAALTAARSGPEPDLPEVRFTHHAWGPGDIVDAHWRPTKADEYMAWYEKATADPPA